MIVGLKPDTKGACYPSAKADGNIKFVAIFPPACFSDRSPKKTAIPRVAVFFVR